MFYKYKVKFRIYMYMIGNYTSVTTSPVTTHPSTSSTSATPTTAPPTSPPTPSWWWWPPIVPVDVGLASHYTTMLRAIVASGCSCGSSVMGVIVSYSLICISKTLCRLNKDVCLHGGIAIFTRLQLPDTPVQTPVV